MKSRTTAPRTPRSSRYSVPALALATALWCGPFTPPAAAQESDLEARLDHLVTRLDERRQTLDVPGLAIADVHGGELVLARGLGLARVEEEVPVTPETLFFIGSSTKAFTATLAALLAEEGLVDLDEPIEEHIPGFRLSDAEAEPSLRDLLLHRTGLARMPLLWMPGSLTPAEMLPYIARAELLSPFRSSFAYSNVNYTLAGHALGRATESDWETLVEERLLEPLGMQASGTRFADFEAADQTAAGYRFDEETTTFEKVPARDLTPIAPAGAIYSNALDMAEWLELPLADPEDVNLSWHQDIQEVAPDREILDLPAHREPVELFAAVEVHRDQLDKG